MKFALNALPETFINMLQVDFRFFPYQYLLTVYLLEFRLTSPHRKVPPFQRSDSSSSAFDAKSDDCVPKCDNYLAAGPHSDRKCDTLRSIHTPAQVYAS